MRRLAKWGAIVCAGLLLLLVLVALFFDWNLVKGYISRTVTAKTGRDFVIDGNLDVRLSFHPVVRAEGVRFANAPWASEKQMLELGAASVRLNLFELIRGRLVLEEVHLTRPLIALEKSPEGKRNWVLKRDEEQSGSEEGPQIGLLQVDEGTLRYRDPTTKTDVRVEISTRDQSDGPYSAEVRASGSVKGLKASLHVLGGSLLSIQDQTTPYPLKAELTIAETTVTAEGTITGIVDIAALDADFALRGLTMSSLFPIIHITLPPTPPYQIKGRLSHQGSEWRYRDFSGKVGDSDLSGDFDVVVRNKRPVVQANLVSQKLDLDDLGGFIGAPPQTGKGETASAEQKTEARAAAKKDRLLPGNEFRLNRLRAMDADVKLDGKSIRGKGRTPIDNLKLHLKIQDGVLKAEPLNFGVADGVITSQIEVDARQDTLDVTTDFSIERLRLSRLVPETAVSTANLGLFGGRAKLRGRGNSLAKMLASSDGTIGFAMTGGRVSNMLLEIVGLDAEEFVKFLLGGDQTVPLRCAVFDFEVKDGKLATKALVVDTTDTKITGEGAIDLNDESMDLTLYPTTKDPSLLSLRSPLMIAGTFKDPTFRPQVQSLALRTGAAVLLGLANPIAALIPFVEMGGEPDSACGALLREVRNETGVKQEHTGTKAEAKNESGVRKDCQKTAGEENAPGEGAR